MSEDMISIPIQRYIAIDAHKNYVMVGGLNARQEAVLAVRRMAMENYPGWVRANLRPGDAVVIEATTNNPLSHFQEAGGLLRPGRQCP